MVICEDFEDFDINYHQNWHWNVNLDDAAINCSFKLELCGVNYMYNISPPCSDTVLIFTMYYWVILQVAYYNLLSENQKAIITVQWYTVENQKAAIAIDFVQR